eukprot:Seg323.9 transcript_id=Seg323.9/GoldUCD/mRNA.D3Y31 product="hypothetical protein" protein_id=Seg323.9/GoldUCD/D3Y31
MEGEKIDGKAARLHAARKTDLSRKRAIKETKIENLVAKKRRIEIHEGKEKPRVRRIVHIDSLVLQLQNGCSQCKVSPLNLTGTSFEKNCSVNRLEIICDKCHSKNVVTLHSSEVEEEMVLGCIHTGLGHSHLEAFLSITGLPCIAEEKFKVLERKVGAAVESIARESVERWREKEKNVEMKTFGNNGLKGAFDASWSKRGGGYNALSGRGTIIGVNTGKCIDFGMKNKNCRTCNNAKRLSQEPSQHDCRKNFSGTAKAMEPAICEDLFKREYYRVLVGDEDSSPEARIRNLVNPNIEKWADKNHVLRTLGKKLHESRTLNFGQGNDKLNEKTKEYILSCFATALAQHKGDAEGLKASLKSIIPHAFGEHNLCGSWCGYVKDPKSYVHRNLPGGRDLVGDGLRCFLEETLMPYMTDETVKKLAPSGSTQRNECINHVIASKYLKIRFYGSSESSDYRTAAGIAQFNENYGYLSPVLQRFGRDRCSDTLTNYIQKYSKKREKQRQRQATLNFKRARKSNKKSRKSKDNINETIEGTSYATGLGLLTSDVTFIQETLASPQQEKELEDGLQVNCERKPVYNRADSSDRLKIIFYDLETGGLTKDSEILQVSMLEAYPSESKSELSIYIMPTKKFDPSSSKIHGLKVSYATGKKELLNKDGNVLPTVTHMEAVTEILEFLKLKMVEGNGRILFVAHNGHTLDQSHLLKFLDKGGPLNIDEKFLYFGDSLPACRKVFKGKTKSFKLIDIHKLLFPDQSFIAHDALEDIKALKSICCHLQHEEQIVHEIVGNSRQLSSIRLKELYDAKERSNENSLTKFLSLDRASQRIAKLGISVKILNEMWSKFGPKMCLSFFATKQKKGKLPRVTKDINELCKLYKIVQENSATVELL